MRSVRMSNYLNLNCLSKKLRKEFTGPRSYIQNTFHAIMLLRLLLNNNHNNSNSLFLVHSCFHQSYHAQYWIFPTCISNHLWFRLYLSIKCNRIIETLIENIGKSKTSSQGCYLSQTWIKCIIKTIFKAAIFKHCKSYWKLSFRSKIV